MSLPRLHSLSLVAAALLLTAAVCFGQAPAPAAAPAKAPEAAKEQPASEGWISMFDGKTLGDWKETPFSGHGPVRVENGTIVLGRGALTGVNWTKPFPKYNYEIRLEASRLQGFDFFAGITFPVYDTFCSWINGGWNGGIVGLSSLDSYDASENETSFFRSFQQGQWYKLRLQVTDRYMTGWIDDEQAFSVDMVGRNIGLRVGEIELSKPLGIASYGTVAGLRNIEYRVLPAEEPAK